MTEHAPEQATRVPSPLTAVRRHCLECCNGSANEVALCSARSCSLHAMRFDRRPDPAEHANDPTPLYPLEAPLTLGEFAAQGMSTLKAIRRRCLDCSGGATTAVRDCACAGCDLWPFRLGKNPNRAGLGNSGNLSRKMPTHGRDCARGEEFRPEIPDAALEPAFEAV